MIFHWGLVFLFIIHLDLFAYSRHQLSSEVSLLWMDVNFLNKSPHIPSQPGGFQFSTFLRIALNNSRCMSMSGTSLSLCNSFFMLFIHLAFLFFLFPYFTPILFCFLCNKLTVCPLCILHLTVGKIFFHHFKKFGFVCFACIVIF